MGYRQPLRSEDLVSEAGNRDEAALSSKIANDG
jgi:hypothetical protein